MDRLCSALLSVIIIRLVSKIILATHITINISIIINIFTYIKLTKKNIRSY